MTKNLYKPVLAGAFLIASTGMSAFGQYYPSQGYQYSQGYQNQAYVGQPAYAGQQLGNLVAPIALYPDSLLSQVLVACTYPQQLAEASQWISQVGYLQGEQRLEAARQQNWDPSVQALVAFPDVLQRLTQDPQWTAELGNAFLNNQAAVMNAVQELRERARQSGRLQSTPQLTVNVENYNGERAIDIVPTNPEVVYVPDYDPAYIWGAPAYGYYPSLYYPSYGFGFGGGIAIGAFFGGYRGGFGHWGWGSNWRDRRVIVDNDFFYRNRFNGYRDGRFSSGSNVWRHDDSRGDSFRSGYGGRQQNFGRGNNYQQPAYSGNNSQQQGFRSNQTTQRYQSASQQPQFGRQQYSTPQSSAPQARGFQSAPQQQYSRPQYSAPQQTRSFQSAPQQQYSRPQYSAPQQTRSFQSAPQQQYSRPQSQPQAQHFEQRGFSGNGGGGQGRR